MKVCKKTYTGQSTQMREDAAAAAYCDIGLMWSFYTLVPAV